MHRTAKNILPNGLRIVTVEAPQLHSAMAAVYVRTGSRHETPENNGATHFLEHILFRGCERFPDGRRMNMRVEDAGGSLNGVTARDHGYYFTPLHPGHVEVGLETLAAMLEKPLLKEVEIEREVILEEMLDELDDDGRDIDIDNLSKKMRFGAHPLGLKIVGTPETVRAMTREKLAEHHARYYVASNMVLAVAGPVKHAEILRLAEKHFGGFPTGSPAIEAPPPAWPNAPHLETVRHDESQSELRFTFPAPPETHPDFPALMVMRRILDDGLSSRLQVNIVDRRGLAYSVQASFDTFVDTGLFEIDLACAHPKLPAAAEALLETLGELAGTTVPDDELLRAKTRFRIGFDFMRDSASELAGWYGGFELFQSSPDFDERIARVEAVTSADVLRVASQMLRRNQLLACVVGKNDAKSLRAIEKLVRDGAALPA